MSEAPEAAGVPARVVESFGRRVIVATGDGGRCPAELFGRRLACVCGDDVVLQHGSSGTQDHPRIVGVGTRRSLFARTDSRGRTEALAANVTMLVVIIAPEPTPDAFIADRYLAGAALAGIDAMVVVNKEDLSSANEPAFTQLIEDYRAAGYTTLTLSAKAGDSVSALRSALAGHVAMLAGQSGVGKSTLMNILTPQSARATRALSDATGEGRHTTVSTALFGIPSGGELIDSPGVRDYAPPLVDDASVQIGWREIVAAAPKCQFNDCLHLREPGCAVTAGVAQKSISARRYESYKRLLNTMRQLAPEYERRRGK